jgi:hypothetical protein
VFERLLSAVAREYGVTKAISARSRRQRNWIEGRGFLDYSAREWGAMMTNDLGNRLNRDSSMIRRLYENYGRNQEPVRDRKIVAAITRHIQADSAGHPRNASTKLTTN